MAKLKQQKYEVRPVFAGGQAGLGLGPGARLGLGRGRGCLSLQLCQHVPLVSADQRPVQPHQPRPEVVSVNKPEPHTPPSDSLSPAAPDSEFQLRPPSPGGSVFIPLSLECSHNLFFSLHLRFSSGVSIPLSMSLLITGPPAVGGDLPPTHTQGTSGDVRNTFAEEVLLAHAGRSSGLLFSVLRCSGRSSDVPGADVEKGGFCSVFALSPRPTSLPRSIFLPQLPSFSSPPASPALSLSLSPSSPQLCVHNHLSVPT